MGKIFIIGGGEIKNFETYPFDKQIVKFTGKSSFKALFIPTASGEAEAYIDTFNRVYGEKLGCQTRTLRLIKEEYTDSRLKDIVLSSDLIYVGGGNTRMMMQTWKSHSLGEILKTAYEQDIVLSGLSAGGICWFEAGYSDSEKFSDPDNWDFITVKGLGLIKGTHCPHYDEEVYQLGKPVSKKSKFKAYIKDTQSLGIALEDLTALQILNDQYRIHTLNENKAYRLHSNAGQVTQNVIPSQSKYQPLNNLYKF